MGRTSGTRALLPLAAAVALLSGGGDLWAQDDLSACFPAIGTYLTRNSLPDGSAIRSSRSLISLTGGGHAFRNDSDQTGGEDGIAFGEGRGSWRCEGREGDLVRISATIVNFTYPGPGEGAPQIARMDYAGSFNTALSVLALEATLRFLPIEATVEDLEASGAGIPIFVIGKPVKAP